MYFYEKIYDGNLNWKIISILQKCSVQILLFCSFLVSILVSLIAEKTTVLQKEEWDNNVQNLADKFRLMAYVLLVGKIKHHLLYNIFHTQTMRTTSKIWFE